MRTPRNFIQYNGVPCAHTEGPCYFCADWPHPMLHLLLPMLAFAFAGAISPGPVNFIAARVGATAGFAHALPHVLGASLSYAAIVWLMGSGVLRLLVELPQASLALQWVGGTYLLYLAARIATAAATPGSAQPASVGAGLWQGALTQSLNPKAWLVALSGVSLFVADSTPASASGPGKLVVFCVVSGTVCFASVAAWAALGQALGRWLQAPGRQVLFNRAMAALLTGVVVSMLWPN